MKEGHTTPFALSEVSGCLVENPECDFAIKFGFSIFCRHPEHASFHAHAAEAESTDKVHILYDTLRQKRRAEFTANLDENGRKAFCLQGDFYGTPKENLDLKQQL